MNIELITYRDGHAVFDLGEGLLRTKGAVGEERWPRGRWQPELRGWPRALRALRALQRLQLFHPPPQRAENHMENQRSINLIDRTINRRRGIRFISTLRPLVNLFFPLSARTQASSNSRNIDFFFSSALPCSLSYSRVERFPGTLETELPLPSSSEKPARKQSTRSPWKSCYALEPRSCASRTFLR